MLAIATAPSNRTTLYRFTHYTGEMFFCAPARLCHARLKHPSRVHLVEECLHFSPADLNPRRHLHRDRLRRSGLPLTPLYRFNQIFD
jgi:hypothetical protein